ncbi:RING/FYVE/PHD zinc finger superfamily protein [Artemisia annua]|uniref:RING/FYVE/PHD zinc finger superfamily protein n=1 Tax=Artemisia annua TaxID=35608 RepID=A0A2U1L203_ARTAN|nr:RING/FYVE/PHD zinc finger superfamily protein [Artemisia annua]
MGDHFVFLVDRLLTEATLEAALESRNPSKQPDPVRNEDAVIDCSSHDVFTPKKLVECRICQDEDFDVNMETPCSCCGSLKYAHRRCVQRWCNEKGDTICEICHQQFKPGYTAPSPVFRLGGIPLNFRGHWQIARRDMNNNPQIIAVVSPDRSFVDQEYDEYADSTSRSVFCFRSVAAIFVVLLFLRHALPVIANRAGSYSFSVFMASNASSSSLSSSDEGETSLTPSQNQPPAQTQAKKYVMDKTSWFVCVMHCPAVGSRSLLNYSGYQQHDLVVELDVTNFNSVLKDTTANHTIIEFYAHWCPACRNYKPEYEKVARLFNGAAATYPDTVLMTRLDCAIKVNTNICDKFSVNHYPMLFWGTPSGFAACSMGGNIGKSEIHTINNGRTANRLLKWINTQLGRFGFLAHMSSKMIYYFMEKTSFINQMLQTLHSSKYEIMKARSLFDQSVLVCWKTILITNQALFA